MFMVLIVVINGDEFGVWLAGSIAGFTLLHELGHAVAARRAGAEAEISLDFMAGYASYTAPQPLSRADPGRSPSPGRSSTSPPARPSWPMGVNPLDEATGRQLAGAAGGVVGRRRRSALFNLLPCCRSTAATSSRSVLERFCRAGPKGHDLRQRGDHGRRAIGIAFVRAAAGIDRVPRLPPADAAAARCSTSASPERRLAVRRGAAALRRETRASRASCVNGLRRPSQSAVLPRPCSTTTAPPTRRAARPSRCRTATRGTSTCWPTCSCARGRYEEAARVRRRATPRAANLIAATVAERRAPSATTGDGVAWLRAAADIGTATDGLGHGDRPGPELASVRRHADVIGPRPLAIATGAAVSDVRRMATHRSSRACRGRRRA